MSLRTPLCDLLDIEHPIMLAGMGGVSYAELAAAVSNAGGYGVLGMAGTQPDFIREQMRKVRTLTDKPFGVNLPLLFIREPRIVDLVAKSGVKFVSTSAGSPAKLLPTLKAAGLTVYHVVPNLTSALKAVEAGVDGLIAVSYGAGGHAGLISPFAALHEIRQIFDGTLLLGGAISTGRQIAAARLMGADMVYMGTRFMATAESMAVERQRQMILEAKAADIVYTPAVSGIPGNFLRASLAAAGKDPDDLTPPDALNFGTQKGDAKAWRDLWAAGQGVGAIDDLPKASELVDRLEADYRAARSLLD